MQRAWIWSVLGCTGLGSSIHAWMRMVLGCSVLGYAACLDIDACVESAYVTTSPLKASASEKPAYEKTAAAKAAA